MSWSPMRSGESWGGDQGHPLPAKPSPSPNHHSLAADIQKPLNPEAAGGHEPAELLATGYDNGAWPGCLEKKGIGGGRLMEEKMPFRSLPSHLLVLEEGYL